MDRAIEGWHWRKSECLIYKEEIFLKILFKSCIYLGRVEDAFATGKKLQQLYKLTNVEESD